MTPDASGSVLTLADLASGQSACVTHLTATHPGRSERLMAYGIAPGQVITLVQRHPAFVVRVDETELALDADVARCVAVDPATA
ncbi:MAG: ferrous iron transport protein A [Chloroflexi bacterium]|nr:ferrous iron transport protein A [Chloroflexota bacterium]